MTLTAHIGMGAYTTSRRAKSTQKMSMTNKVRARSTRRTRGWLIRGASGHADACKRSKVSE
jgi:hypothetical protein